MKTLCRIGLLLVLAYLFPSRTADDAPRSEPKAIRVFPVASAVVVYTVVVVVAFVVFCFFEYSKQEIALRVGAILSLLGALYGAASAAEPRSRPAPGPSTTTKVKRQTEHKDRLALSAWVGVILGALLAFSALLFTPPESAEPKQASGGVQQIL